jgi:hypothetical protein
MGKKPSLWLSGLLLAGLASTGCETCGSCFGSKDGTPSYLAGGSNPALKSGWNNPRTQTAAGGAQTTYPTGGMSVGRTGTPYGAGGAPAGLGNGQIQSTVPQQRMAEKTYIPTDSMRVGTPGVRTDDLPPTDPVVVPAGMDRTMPQGTSGMSPSGAAQGSDVGTAVIPASPEPPPAGVSLGAPPGMELPPAPSGGRQPELHLPPPPPNP